MGVFDSVYFKSFEGGPLVGVRPGVEYQTKSMRGPCMEKFEVIDGWLCDAAGPTSYTGELDLVGEDLPGGLERVVARFESGRLSWLSHNDLFAGSYKRSLWQRVCSFLGFKRFRLSAALALVAALGILAACQIQRCSEGATCTSGASTGPSSVVLPPAATPSPSASPSASPAESCRIDWMTLRPVDGLTLAAGQSERISLTPYQQVTNPDGSIAQREVSEACNLPRIPSIVWASSSAAVIVTGGGFEPFATRVGIGEARVTATLEGKVSNTLVVR